MGRDMLFLLVVLSFVGISIVNGSVQNPELTSCTSSPKVDVSDVSITKAKIGETMVLNFTLTVSESLESDPKLEITLKKDGGSALPCIGSVGSCTYKMCGGTSSIEKALGQQWNNECPIPTMTAKETISAELDPLLKIILGSETTTISVELKVTEGGTTVGCESFEFKIEAA